MSTIDFLVSLATALAAAAALYFHQYPLSLFATLFFLLVVTNIVVFHARMPQPRWLIGIGVPREKAEDEEEEEDEE